MEVTILLPRRVDGDESCPNVPMTNPNELVLVLQVHRSRVLWRELHPCLFSKKRKSARALLSILLQYLASSEQVADLTKKNGSGTSRSKAVENTLNLESNEEKDDGGEGDEGLVDEVQSPRPFRRRKLRLAFDTNTQNSSNKNAVDIARIRITLWIQPPLETRIEPYFSGLLIKYEHELVQASSLAAYFATLGGGFFLCRHLQTALTLARQQQRMAVFLGDYGMYYRCLLNQAYNYIYAGHFQVANQLIAQVRVAATEVLKSDAVLLQMCASAKLFSKRVRKARQTPVTKEQQQQLTKDDLYRIRMVQDQSLPSTDVTAPFRRK
jgi:hypothetical protein